MAIYQCAEAQNVTSLDGLSPVITKQDERFLASWYRPQGGTWQEFQREAAEFRCDAFKRLHSEIVLVRKWRFEEPDTLLFEETIGGTSVVRFESRICLGDAEWSPLQTDYLNAGKLSWQGKDGSVAHMTVRPLAHCSMSVHPCMFLPEYGVKKEGRVLVLEGMQKLPFSWNIEWKFRKPS